MSIVVKIGADTRGLEKEMKNLNGIFSGVGGGVMRVGDQLTNGISRPLKDLGREIFETGMDFEVSMKRMQGIARVSGDDYKMLEKKARELGATTSKSAIDAADSFTYMALAGWDVNQMMEGAKPILDLSIATQMDLKTASDLVTDSLSSMKMEVKDLPKYLDTVARAQSLTNTEAEDLMKAFLKCGNTARNLNIPLAETSAALGIFANNGLKGSLAGTKLNRILLRITAQSDPAVQAWKKMGVQVFDNNGKFRGLTTVLNEARVGLSKMTQEQQMMTLKQAVTADNVVAFKQLIEATDGTLQDLTGSLENSDGALDQLRSTMEDTTKNKIDQMKSALQESMLQVFQTMAPIITDVALAIKDLAEAFGKLDPDTQKMFVFGAAALAATGPVLSLAGGIMKITGGVGKAIGGLNSMAGKLFNLGKGGKVAKTVVEGVASSTVKGAAASAAGSAAMDGMAKAAMKNAKAMNTANKKIQTVERQTRGGGMAARAFAKHAAEASDKAVDLALASKNMGSATATAAKGVEEVATKTAAAGGKFGKLGALLGKGTSALGGFAMSALNAMGPVGILATTVGVVGGSLVYLNHKAEAARKALEVQSPTVLKTKDMWNALKTELGEVGAGYIDMANKGVEKTIELAESGKVVTQQNVDDILSIYKKGNENISKEMDRRYQEEVKKMQEQGFIKLGLTQVEFGQVLEEMKKKHEEEKKLLAGFEAEKKKILQDASNEKRALRNDEAMKMFEIQMKENELVIGSMTVGETQKQQLVQQSNMTILSQAEDKKNELIKKAEQERDSTIEAAQQQYLKQMEIAERIRSEGGAKAEETANKIIKEAERQRDDTIKAAGETYRNGIKVLNSKYEELANRSGLTREAVLGDLAQISYQWDNWTPSPKTLGITYQVSTIETYKRQWAEGSKTWQQKQNEDRIRKRQNSVFGGSRPSISEAMKMYPGRAKGGTIFGTGWSLVGENGPELMHQSQGKTKVYPLSSQDSRNGIGNLGGGRTINIEKMIVRDDNDIRKIAQELDRLQDEDNYSQGKVKYF